MQISKLPMSIIIGLELAAGATGCNGLGPCLDMPVETESGTTNDNTTEVTTGPCLSPPLTTSSSSAGTTVGPCLDYLPPTTSGTTSDMTSSTSSGSTGTTNSTSTTTVPETTSTGPCLDFPPTTGGALPDEDPDAPPQDAEQPKTAVIDRVLSTSSLPEDVKARLRERVKKE